MMIRSNNFVSQESGKKKKKSLGSSKIPIYAYSPWRIHKLWEELVVLERREQGLDSSWNCLKPLFESLWLSSIDQLVWENMGTK